MNNSNADLSRFYINNAQKILDLFARTRGLLIFTSTFTLVLAAFCFIKPGNDYISQVLLYIAPIAINLLGVGWTSSINGAKIQGDKIYLDTPYNKEIGFPVRQAAGLLAWEDTHGEITETKRLNREYKTMCLLLLAPQMLALALCIVPVWSL